MTDHIFAGGLEVKFSSINERLSQVISSTSSNDSVLQDNVSQDTSNHSFPILH